MKRTFTSFAVLAGILWVVLINTTTGCANIIPPTGGPRDSLPPVLISAVPKDSAVNFTGNRINLEFDEYIQLDNNLNDQLIVSPNPEKTPVIEGKLRIVSIRLKDSLKPNTTYSINFGNAIKDVNENNPYKNFTYVFSTGSKLDDGVITGNVKLAETGGADSQLLVVLHRNLDDTAVKKLKSDYYTRLDSSGNFTFRYLPNERFAIYVLPNDYSKKYDDSTKMFGFYDSVVTATTSPSKIKLYAYEEHKLVVKPVAPSSSNNRNSGNQKEEDKRLRYTNNLENNEQDLLDSLEFTFNRPIAKFDSTLLQLTDTSYKPLATSYKIIHADTVGLRFALLYPWKENEFFKLTIQKETFTDSAGVSLSKADTIAFKTKREGQYGSVRLRFVNIDLTRNPVLQIVQNKAVIQSVVLTGKEWYQRLIKPGQYDLRILYDKNKNGVWDPGVFETKIQPEIVERVKRPVTIKANWDNEVDITM